ncbi:hypothetical protein VIBNISO65_830018 [Vibrio nigripulchritudo SO65]|nr:hypothetical protein VIBNIAM115_840018 [Vibrio nigripulchritudo AM115]CCN79080.1 hypothetical protein VIBNISO65_830018 [Vibrio nigripulchritudo SO65]
MRLRAITNDMDSPSLESAILRWFYSVKNHFSIHVVDPNVKVILHKSVTRLSYWLL